MSRNAKSGLALAALAGLVVAALVALKDGERDVARGTPAIEGGSAAEAPADVEAIGAPAFVDGAGGPVEARVVDRERREVSLANEPHLALAVRDADARPLAAVKVVVFRSGAVLFVATTGAAGDALVPALETDAEVAIWPLDRVPFRLPLAAGEGERVLVAPRGHAVAGVALAAGRPVREPLELTFLTHASIVAPEDFPAAVFQEMGYRGASRSNHLRRTLDRNGRFRFEGLPANVRGQLQLPRGWFCAPDRTSSARRNAGGVAVRSFDVPRPDEGIVLEIARTIRLRGRVVDDDTGDAIPHARVTFRQRVGGSSWGSGTGADAEGRFEVELEDPLAERGLSVELSDANGAGEREVSLDSENARVVDFVWDVGDLAIRATRTVHLRVLGPGDAPVQGAIVSSPTEGQSFWNRPESAPTDADGRTSIEIGHPVTLLHAVAPGMEPAAVELPRVPPDPVVVRLEPGTLLEIQATNADGVVPEDLRIEVGSSEPLFELTEHWVPPNGAITTSGSRGMSTSHGNDGGFLRLGADPSGRLALTGVRAGIDLSVAVLGPRRVLLVETTVAPLEPGEHRRVELDYVLRERTLRVRVVDSFGGPVEGAQLRIGRPGRHHDLGVTGGDGRFEETGYLPPTVALTVDKAGMTSFVDDEFDVPESGREVEVVMPASLEIGVRVVDPDDEDVFGAHVALRGDDGNDVGRRGGRRGGAFVFEDLPVGEVEIVVRIGDGIYRQRHHTGDGDATIEVGPAAALDVRCVFDRDPPEGRLRLGMRPSSQEGSVWGQTVYADRADVRDYGWPAVLADEYEVWLDLVSSSTGELVTTLVPIQRVTTDGVTPTRVTLRY